MNEELDTVPADAGNEQIVSPPNPIEVDNVDHEAEAAAAEKAKTPPEPKPAEKKLSTREALEKAAEKVKADDKGDEGDKDKAKAKPDDQPKKTVEPDKAKEPVKAEQQPEDKAAPVVDPNKPRQPHDDAPSRFSAEAKAAWAEAPEHVRAETHRAFRELETGIQEHQRRWEPIKPYDDLARQHGTTIDAALERYVAFDKLLNDDFVKGLESICADKGMNLRDVVAQLAGQKPDQAQSQTDTTIRELRAKVAELERHIGGVSKTIQTQQAESIDAEVSAFAADHPNIDALANRIVEHINAGLSLDQAYAKAEEDARQEAERLGFIPKPADPTPAAPSAQTDKGIKSIAGAPGSGSSPAARKPSSNVRDAVRRAMEAAG
ncbi:hypothetical protein N8A98_22350 [Devosia neptuniae]|uniref:Scaffolding protein n=1 Tax=Devosia neptuniae TaxID=191302 RepID=A0ABY6CCF9_9HYPH|nr:hypothetical protein [Devosia neptuniae]UXN69915.1 hypothetical protein N8A98_22350 [Devosia neptuniae]